VHGLPEHFVRTQRELYGARGEAWVENLPALIAACERRWSLKVGAPLENLSYYNILRAARQPWLAIDPKGLVGEPAYEVGAFLRNPDLEAYTPAELKALQARRVDQFAAALGMDRERILAWSMAQAVLSAWWTYEDHGWIDEPAMALAQIFAELMG
jgi:streptomycin 6-kinase